MKQAKLSIKVSSEANEIPQGYFQVEKIIEVKKVSKKVTQYLIKWKGYSHEQNTWEYKSNLKGVQNLIEAFFQQKYKSQKSSEQENNTKKELNIIEDKNQKQLEQSQRINLQSINTSTVIRWKQLQNSLSYEIKLIQQGSSKKQQLSKSETLKQQVKIPQEIQQDLQTEQLQVSKRKPKTQYRQRKIKKINKINKLREISEKYRNKLRKRNVI